MTIEGNRKQYSLTRAGKGKGNQMLNFVGIINHENTVTVDGYSTRKTAKGAISEMGRYIAKHIDKGEGEMIVRYGLDSLLPASESYGGYFMEVEEVACASEWDDDLEEMNYAEGNWYVVVRIVRG